MLLLSLFASSAWANDPALAAPKGPTARQRFTQGNRLYRIRKFDEAIIEYQAGAVIELAPVFDYNLGQCYRQLGQYTDAIWHYERFLKNGRPGAELHAFVTTILRQMRVELERKAMAQPPTDVGETGSPRARLGGSSSASRTDLASAMVVHSDAQWYSDRIGWALVAGGGLGGGVATYLLMSASSLREDADRTLAEDRRGDLRDTSGTRHFVGIVVGIGSAGLIATGMVKLAFHANERLHPKSVSWGVAASPHSAYVFGRF
ncbi:MAG TPA: tetratricopeptide repeat protein [Kofleriaceae bacterium]|nr:tetratricopeptide repeat protein [Kofleriaceae bacterium]